MAAELIFSMGRIMRGGTSLQKSFVFINMIGFDDNEKYQKKP
ncbi:MAG: hypothetical protein PF589_10395 [Gammaproteobacteria bacterium]|jgi:hypothetical protein|nr:hypothetical protein [Gammaproteobacteria bacterium]